MVLGIMYCFFFFNEMHSPTTRFKLDTDEILIILINQKILKFKTLKTLLKFSLF